METPQFRIASGLAKEDPSKQINTLLYCLGDTSEDVLLSTNATEEERKVYATVLSKFDSFFKVRKNIIYERARFNRRNQKEGESADEYIMELYKLVKDCEYGTFESEMIRDRLVVGIKDGPLSEKLQSDSNLTLEKAKQEIRQREAIQSQQQELKAGDGGEGLDELKSRRKFKPHPKKSSQRQAAQHTKPASCGKGQHTRDKCPAREAVCHRCNKKGHFKSQCFSKELHATTQDAEESLYLDAVILNQPATWAIQVQLDGKDVPFKVDTGAEVTAISEETYQGLSTTKSY